MPHPITYFLHLIFPNYPNTTHRYLHTIPTRRSSDIGLTKNHITIANITGIMTNSKVTVQPTISTNIPANNGLSSAPIFPHKFIHPDTEPEKLRPKSVAAAQLIPVAIPIPPKHNGSHKTLTTKLDRKSTRLNSSHVSISYAVFCLKKK